MLSGYQVSTLLGKSESWFEQNITMLRKLGFPPVDQVFKGWDANAIHLWLDQRSNLTENPGEGDLGERIRKWRKST